MTAMTTDSLTENYLAACGHARAQGSVGATYDGVTAWRVSELTSEHTIHVGSITGPTARVVTNEVTRDRWGNAVPGVCASIRVAAPDGAERTLSLDPHTFVRLAESAQETPATLDGVAAVLRRAHQAGAIDPFEILAKMLTTAGAHHDWPRDTVDHIAGELDVIEKRRAVVGLPSFRRAGEPHLFWASVAQDAGFEHDWPRECPEDDCGQLLVDTEAAVKEHYAEQHPEWA